MDNISLKHLRYFMALARTGHFGRAADACAVTQPALSMKIKELEETLGVVLIERGPRQIRLTAFGEKFAEHTRDVLLAVNELGDLARASREELSGRLRVGMIPTIAPYLLSALIVNLARTNPELHLNVREAITSKLIEELDDGRLDAAIVALPVSEPSLTEVALFEEKFLFVRPAKDKRAPLPSRDELREMSLLLLEEGHCFRQQALSFCKIRTTTQREFLDANSLSTLVQMVGAGLGVTLIPEMAEAQETRSALVSVSRFKDPQPSRTVGIIWRKTNPLAQQLLQFSDVVLHTFNSLHRRQQR